MIGKGARLPEVVEAYENIQRRLFWGHWRSRRTVGQMRKKAELIAYEDLGAEALRKLYVEEMPLIVIIDCNGNNLYKEGRAAYLAEHQEK